MAQVPYYVNDALGAILKELGLSGYEELGGHYAFTSVSAYNAAVTQANDAIWVLLDDDNLDNDDRAYELMDILGDLETNTPTLMYWSTEKASWV